MSAVAHELGIRSFREDVFPPNFEKIFNDNKETAEKVSTFTDPIFRQHFERNEQEILRSAAGLNGSVLIFVTDGGFDIPVKKLAEQFGQVTLAAIHRSSALSAVEKVSLEDRRKVDICVADFTGWLKRFSQVIPEIAQRAPFIRTQPPLVINPENSGYDFIVSSCTSSSIRSKLENSLFPSPLCQYCPSSCFLDKIEEEHLALLSGLAKPTGRVFASLPISKQCFNLNGLPASDRINLLNQYVTRRFRGQFENCSATQWEWNIPRINHFDKVQILAMTLNNKPNI